MRPALALAIALLLSGCGTVFDPAPYSPARDRSVVTDAGSADSIDMLQFHNPADAAKKLQALAQGYADERNDMLREQLIFDVPMCGRRPVGKGFLHVCSGSVQPCVRPTCAVLMTAGHNALRESGPGQNPAFEHAMAHVGCPDRRIDRHCITCCSPSQLQVTPLCRRDFGYAASAAGSL